MGEVLKFKQEPEEEAPAQAGGSIDDILHQAEEQMAKDRSFETLFGAMADAAEYADTIHKIPEIAKRYPALQGYCKRKITQIKEFSEQAKQDTSNELSWGTIEFFHTLRRVEEELAKRDIKALMPDLQFEKMTALDASITTSLDYQRAHPSDNAKKRIQECEEILSTLDTGFESYLMVMSEDQHKDAPYERADYLSEEEKRGYRTRVSEERHAALDRFEKLVRTHGINPDIHARDIKITR